MTLFTILFILDVRVYIIKFLVRYGALQDKGCAGMIQVVIKRAESACWHIQKDGRTKKIIPIGNCKFKQLYFHSNNTKMSVFANKKAVFI